MKQFLEGIRCKFMYEEVFPHLSLDTDFSKFSFLFTLINWSHERKAALNYSCIKVSQDKWFFGGLKILFSTFCIGTDGCKKILHLQCLQKCLWSSFVLLRKHLLISGFFPGSRIGIPPPPPPSNETSGNSKGIVSLNSAFENADSQSSTCYVK